MRHIVNPVRVPLVRLLADVGLGIRERAGRVVLTSLGTVLGVASLVAILGLAGTARVHVSGRFDAYRATEVSVTDQHHAAGDSPFSGDVDAALGQLNGVVAGGVLWMVDSTVRVHSAALPDAPGGRPAVLPVVAASAGGLAGSGPVLDSGRPFEAFHERRGERVALLGAAAAAELGLTGVERQYAISVDGVPFTVVGILRDSRRRPDALGAVVVPAATATKLWGGPAAAEDHPVVLIAVQAGAASLVGRQAPYALHPADPERLAVSLPPDMAEIQERIDEDLQRLVLVLAGVCLALGVVGIANANLVAVVERVAEIGLRKALGARPRHIAALFLAESVAVGSLAALVGLWLGVCAVVVVSLVQGWRPAVPPLLLSGAPLLGAATGAVAGAYPALRAARLEAVEALRR